MQPQYPQYPQYPQQPAYPPPAPAYGPPPGYPAPGYPPAGYYPPQPPVQPTVQGTLEDFFDAPSSGNKAWVFKDRPIGTRYAGIVARPIGKSDIRHQTDQQGQPQRFRDGRPKFVMVVPMLVQVSPEFPEGQASWWVKGQARDELVRAMAEAGAPAGPPEAGAGITVTLVGMRPIPGFNPAFQYRITYQRPTGIVQSTSDPWAGQLTPGQLTPAQTVEPVRPGAGAYPPPQPMVGYGPVPPPQPAPVEAPPQWAQPQPQQVPVAPAVAAGPPAAAPVMAPNNLTDEQQALLAQLTGS